MFYGHFRALDRLNGPSDFQRYWNEVKDETPFRSAHAWVRTQVVMICGPTRYQLDHECGPDMSLTNVPIETPCPTPLGHPPGFAVTKWRVWAQIFPLKMPIVALTCHLYPCIYSLSTPYLPYIAHTSCVPPLVPPSYLLPTGHLTSLNLSGGKRKLKASPWPWEYRTIPGSGLIFDEISRQISGSEIHSKPKRSPLRPDPVRSWSWSH